MFLSGAIQRKLGPLYDSLRGLRVHLTGFYVELQNPKPYNI